MAKKNSKRGFGSPNYPKDVAERARKEGGENSHKNDDNEQ